MALTEYQKKRDFSRTAEPKGSTRARRKHSDRLLFTMQKHDARRLHYDLRLEHDGVLLSWAVPKGPSLDPADKRLAVRTEDHPIDYAEFEGTIPAGEYGAGTVLLWDSGTWTPEDDVAAGLKKGKLHFSLSGEKLKGRWHLQRLRSRDEGDQENWLLIKGKDDFALPENGDVVVESAWKACRPGAGCGKSRKKKRN